MEKRSRPPQGFYKSIETPLIPRCRKVCERKPEVLSTFEAERIMAKKIVNGRPYYMVKWCQRKHLGAERSPAGRLSRSLREP